MGKILETDVTVSMEPGADVDGWDGWMGASFDAVERYATRRKWHMNGMLKKSHIFRERQSCQSVTGIRF